MGHIGYIVKSTKERVYVVMPEKPFGKLVVTLPQRRNKFCDAECFEKYEVFTFDIYVDSHRNIIDWRLYMPSRSLESHYFVALLADKKILADDGKLYTLWDNDRLADDRFSSHLDYAFSNGDFSSIRNIKLYTKGSVIYGTEKCNDYKFRNSWDVQDSLANHLNTYDRYYVVNNSEKREKAMDILESVRL